MKKIINGYTLLFFVLVLLSVGVGFKISKDMVSHSTLNKTRTNTHPTLTPIKPTMSVKKNIQLYFIAINDGGKSGKKIGCDDSLVPIDAGSSVQSIKDAYEKLFHIKTSTYDNSGLYNSLYQSDLQVNHAEIKKGEANIELTGRFSIAGTCDEPRFVEQLKAVAQQFPEVKAIDITINDQPIEDIFSGKGNEASPEAIIKP